MTSVKAVDAHLDRLAQPVEKVVLPIQRACDFPAVEIKTSRAILNHNQHSAFAHDPSSAWLVVACDLPRLSSGVLRDLLLARDSQELARAYCSAHNGLPEPLCTIYEPGIRPLLEAALLRERNCPSKILMEAGERVRLLPPRNDSELDNFHTPEEAAALLANSTDCQKMKKTIHLQYFAILREEADRATETLITEAPDAEALYRELTARHRFTLDTSQIRVACDGQYRSMDTALTDQMRLTFIPPVAGG